MSAVGIYIGIYAYEGIREGIRGIRMMEVYWVYAGEGIHDIRVMEVYGVSAGGGIRGGIRGIRMCRDNDMRY